MLSSLANDAAVRSVYLDKGGVFSAAKPGSVILEMSTVSPELSRQLHQEAGTRGVSFLDVQWFLIGPGPSGVQIKLVVNLLLGLASTARY